MAIDPNDYRGTIGTQLNIPTHVSPSGGQTTHPSVVRFDTPWNGWRYWMAHTPYPGGDDAEEDPNIAVSSDGTSWSEPAGLTNPLDDNPGSPNAYNSDVNLVYRSDTNTLYLFWRELDRTLGSNQEKIYFRTSTDGTTWTTKTLALQVTATNGKLLSPSFNWTGSQWVLHAVDMEQNPNVITRRLSSGDSLTSWGEPVDCSLAGEGVSRDPWHLETRVVDGQWVALITTTTQGTSGLNTRLHLAASTTGTNWECNPEPIVPTEGPGHDGVYKASFIPIAQDGGIDFDVWYSAVYSASSTWNIFRTAIERIAHTRFTAATFTDVEAFPRRNLGPAEYWGRTVEERIKEAEETWGATNQSVGGLTRASDASLGQLAKEVTALKLAFDTMPIVESRGATKSGFALGAGWNTVLSGVLPATDRASCNVIAIGNIHLNADDGGTSSPGFTWPFDLSLVTSEYGPRSGRFHEGIDFAGGAASAGNAIPCAADGTVQTAGYSPGFGNYVIVNHGIVGDWGNTAYTLYAHMNATPSVSQGASVSQGQTLGFVGNTGYSFGAHLHFETHYVIGGGNIIWDTNNPSYASNRTAVNPRDFMNQFGGSGTPSVDSDVVARFVIEGSASSSFRPLKDLNASSGLPMWFNLVHGRTLLPSGPVDVALQVWTTAGLPDYPSNRATLSIEGIFS